MNEESANCVPLRRGSEVVGFVRLVPSNGSRICGDFVPGPDYATYGAPFERAREAWKRVDVSAPEDYEGEWHLWSEALRAINELELTFGDQAIPIESFEIDGDFRVEFEPALWWQVQSESSNCNEPSDASDQDRHDVVS